MPDIQKIKLDFQNLYSKSRKNLENLGYGTIGKDIRLELFIKGKKKVKS
jgi:hypothetical protein